MNPVWWAMGEAMPITSSAVSPSRSTKAVRLAYIVLDVCITPLGSPVVPLV